MAAIAWVVALALLYTDIKTEVYGAEFDYVDNVMYDNTYIAMRGCICLLSPKFSIVRLISLECLLSSPLFASLEVSPLPIRSLCLATNSFVKKQDPDTKGRVENVVKFVKTSFFDHKVFCGIDNLNSDLLRPKLCRPA